MIVATPKEAVAALGRSVAWADRFGGTRRFHIALFVASLAVFGIESIAWPLHEGRDGTTYLMYYGDMWHAHASLPELMLFRTPLAPLLYGPLLQFGGAILAEIGAACFFAVSIWAVTLAASAFGGLTAVMTALALLLYPGYGALFHQVSSDPAFALVFALFVLAAVRAGQRPTLQRFAVAAGVGFLMVMARPSAQIFLAFALVPPVLPGSWRERLARSFAFAVPLIALLAGWAALNDLRYGDFTVSRGAGATVPFYRVFVLDHLLSANDGPASRRLARVVQNRLLPLPVYRDRGVRTTQQFFARGGDWAWGDLVVVSDRAFGWHSGYSTMRGAALEAIEHNWRLYAHDVAGAVKYELTTPYEQAASSAAVSKPGPSGAAKPSRQPTEPGGVLWWLATTPDGHISAHLGQLVWPTAAAQAHYEHLVSFVAGLESDLPNRSGSTAAARVLNGLSRAYPWLALWIAIGLVALLARRPVGWRIVAALAGLGLILVVTTMAAMPSDLEYALPVAPAFLLIGTTGICGRRATAPSAVGEVVSEPVVGRAT